MAVSQQFDITKTLFWNIILWFVKYAAILSSVVSTACIIWACAVRYLFQGNFYGSDEIILLFAFWLYFMGAAYGSYEDSHIKADLINIYVKNIRLKDSINLFALFITIVVNLIILTWAWHFFMWGLERMPLSTGLKIPMVIPQSSVFFGMLFMAFYHIFHFVRNLKGYIKFGHYSVPTYGDYMTPAVKAKFPQANVPLKSEIKAMEEYDENEGGEC